jgi:hypothetical protein
LRASEAIDRALKAPLSAQRKITFLTDRQAPGRNVPRGGWDSKPSEQAGTPLPLGRYSSSMIFTGKRLAPRRLTTRAIGASISKSLEATGFFD